MNGPELSVTAGNASGVNDGACALIVACEDAVKRFGLTPRARIVGMGVAGVPPRIMGIGPAPATQKLLARSGLTLAQMDTIELNRSLRRARAGGAAPARLADDDAAREPNGGAIAIGHPLGMSGARL